MNKQNVVCSYNGILFTCKQEWSTDTCYHKDESWKIILDERIRQNVLHHTIHLYGMLRLSLG
jgi:hypothetical protein